MSTLSVFAFLAAILSFFAWVASRSPSGLIGDLSIGSTESVNPGEPVLRATALATTLISFGALVSTTSDYSATAAWSLLVVIVMFTLPGLATVGSFFDRLYPREDSSPGQEVSRG